MNELEELYVHQVQVETFKGTGSWGDVYENLSDPVPCFLDNQTQLTRDQSGAEVVSTATVYAALSAAPQFTVGSLVHLPGRKAQVIGCNPRDGGTLGLPSHVEVNLA